MELRRFVFTGGGKPLTVGSRSFDKGLGWAANTVLVYTPAADVRVNVRSARMLMLRMSCNWDDNGKSDHDHGDWADAKLIGKSQSR